ncbi:MAG: phospholipid-binding protein MlaC [Geminicoccaceae bacterium]
MLQPIQFIFPVIALATFLMTSGVGPALAQQRPTAEAARSHVATLANDAFEVLRDDSIGTEQRDDEIRRLVDRGFDIDHIARFVLGSEYRQLDEQQLSRYRDAYRAYVLETYGRYLEDYAVEEFETTGTTETSERDRIVETRAVPRNEAPVAIDWRVRNRDGEPKIIDIVIEGVSQAITQRNEFSSVISRRGIDGLIDLLQERSSGAT